MDILNAVLQDFEFVRVFAEHSCLQEASLTVDSAGLN